MSPTNGVWIMNSTTALALSQFRNALGQREFDGITMMGGTFEGMPVIVSQYVSGGTGSPAEDSLLILVNASDIYLADDGQVVVDASREASLQMLDNPTNHSGTGTPTTMVSMFQTNSIAIRAERFINWQRRRAAAVAYVSGVAYTG
jgi:HK97 family phage major capsid protein